MNESRIRPWWARVSRSKATTMALVAMLSVTLIATPLSVDAKPPADKGPGGSAGQSGQAAKPAQGQSRERPRKTLHVHPQRLTLVVGETASLRAFLCADDGRDRSGKGYRPADDPACALSRNATWRVAKGRPPGTLKAKGAAVSFTASKPAAAVKVVATSSSGLTGAAEVSIDAPATGSGSRADKPRAAKPQTAKSSGSPKPKPEKPKAAEPKPAEPKPEKPRREKPKPAEPKPEKPKAAEPKPEKPKQPTTAEPEKPKAAEPKPAKPKRAEPKPAEPKPEKPKPEKPKPEKPKPEKPKPEKPKKPTTAEPRTVRPRAAPQEADVPRAVPKGARSGDARRDATSASTRASERRSGSTKTPDTDKPEDKRSASERNAKRTMGEEASSPEPIVAIPSDSDGTSTLDESSDMETRSPGLGDADLSPVDEEPLPMDAQPSDAESPPDPDAALLMCEEPLSAEDPPAAPDEASSVEADLESPLDPDAQPLPCAEPPTDAEPQLDPAAESPVDPAGERPTEPADETAPQSSPSGPDYDYTSAAARGRWSIAGTDIVQSATVPADYLSGVRALPDSFRISARIQLPPGGGGPKDVGAGLVVSMRSPGDLRHGYLVRFARGGRELFWGRYGADGLFYAQDGVSTLSAPGAWRRLELDVNGGSMRISVDGATVARGVPVGAGDRYFGLLGFGGGVRFRDVEVFTNGGVQPLSGR